MLTHLHIENLAVIEQLDLDLDPGFTVFTGETGAGKSIVIDAIGLILGERANPSLIRAGRPRLRSRRYSICPRKPALCWRNGISKRVIPSARSRAN